MAGSVLLALTSWSQLAGDLVAEGITVEIDLRAGSSLVVEIEQKIPDRAALDRGNQGGDGLAIVSRNRTDLGGVKMALAAEVARLVLAGEREHSGPRRTFFLENDQRTGAIEKKMNLFGQQLTQVFSTVSLPVRIAAARSRTSAG